MKVSAKLGMAFCVAAVFLLAVEIAAVIIVGRLNEILSETTNVNLQAGQVAEAIHAFRVAPTRTSDHLARLEDLARWARTAEEQQLVAAAQTDLTAGHSVSQAVGHLETLGALYHQQTTTINQRLLIIHQRVIYGLIIIMINSVLLFILLTRLVRHWLVRPVENLVAGLTAPAAGDLERKLVTPAGEEFRQITQMVNQMKADRDDLRARVEGMQRLAAVGEACSHVTHNVRSLLSSIRSLAQHESTATAAKPDSRVGFNYIIALVNKLDSWVRDVHSTVANAGVRLAAHDLERIVHDAIALMEPKVSEKGLQVDYQTADELPRVMIDRGLFEQAFWAVLSNAIEASPEEGCVRVHLQNGEHDRVCVVIEDTGTGMREQTKARAFEPFFTTKPESTGLGLTIAHSIVTKHGGEIVIDSALNKGTRVEMRFPVAKSN